MTGVLRGEGNQHSLPGIIIDDQQVAASVVRRRLARPPEPAQIGN